ncbi:SDR family oxidoreductase [Duganella sp.]|uniref:SDR family oxidoreductase n=1 Tax=Duganella sp. TaxID=1904440 RepID=UPI0031DE57D2
MTIRLKKLSSQVVVVTGATSGIGLTTARMAAGKGAKLVLAARDSEALDKLAAELRAGGHDALAVPTDVGLQEEVQALGRAAIKRFGRIDSWINNAGVSIFGRYRDVPLEDHHKLFQTNFWGVVHGSLTAMELMRENGGAIINLGSEVSERAVPLQGMYSASKHAVKGFTDSLRMEAEKDELPIAVTLIKPAAIDTMFVPHARNYMKNEPELPAPLYAPELVADAILYAAEHPQRDIFVGGAAKMISMEGHGMPRVLDKVMNMLMFRQQQKDQPAAPDRSDALYKPNGLELQQRQGGHESPVLERSAYTYLTTRGKPLALSLLVGGALLAAWKMSTPQAAPATQDS